MTCKKARYVILLLRNGGLMWLLFLSGNSNEMTNDRLGQFSLLKTVFITRFCFTRFSSRDILVVKSLSLMLCLSLCSLFFQRSLPLKIQNEI